ncbi:UNVERIFIED_CONTAM: hypothetical protein HDU68_001192 [Siphonaria sp. JEL0065]|nr:hypothetical protein HDU68_001192 [Siphonaria sp. JEL0065]
MQEGLSVLGGELDERAMCEDEQKRILSLKRTRITSIVDEYEQEIQDCRIQIKRLREGLIALETENENLRTTHQTKTPLLHQQFGTLDTSTSNRILEDVEKNPFLASEEPKVSKESEMTRQELQQLVMLLQCENGKLKEELKEQKEASVTTLQHHPTPVGPITPSKSASDAFKRRIAELERENANLNLALLKSDEYIERLKREKADAN